MGAMIVAIVLLAMKKDRDKVVKNWILRFLNKVWNKIKAFLIKGLDIALNLLDKKMVVRGDGYSFGGF